MLGRGVQFPCRIVHPAALHSSEQLLTPRAPPEQRGDTKCKITSCKAAIPSNMLGISQGIYPSSTSLQVSGLSRLQERSWWHITTFVLSQGLTNLPREFSMFLGAGCSSGQGPAAPSAPSFFIPFFSPRVPESSLCVSMSWRCCPCPTSPPWLSSCARCGCHTFTSPKMRLDLGGAESEHELRVAGMIYWGRNDLLAVTTRVVCPGGFLQAGSDAYLHLRKGNGSKSLSPSLLSWFAHPQQHPERLQARTFPPREVPRAGPAPGVLKRSGRAGVAPSSSHAAPGLACAVGCLAFLRASRGRRPLDWLRGPNLAFLGCAWAPARGCAAAGPAPAPPWAGVVGIPQGWGSLELTRPQQERRVPELLRGVRGRCSPVCTSSGVRECPPASGRDGILPGFGNVPLPRVGMRSCRDLGMSPCLGSGWDPAGIWECPPASGRDGILLGFGNVPLPRVGMGSCHRLRATPGTAVLLHRGHCRCCLHHPPSPTPALFGLGIIYFKGVFFPTCHIWQPFPLGDLMFGGDPAGLGCEVAAGPRGWGRGGVTKCPARGQIQPL
ncbi:uncharacterized protein LOC125319113 isoform X2 [Corvus hawaiiensis]|uniref:uncharacterized protein LOC125319113 isoform X2 n=1 Tax=Corvus hawaiiensis TaxID=134902 RepID=UPI002019CA1D|nr:uncharacterized protein LOC125319113 isoform X2 [Corvus hawaiiensis]